MPPVQHHQPSVFSGRPKIANAPHVPTLQTIWTMTKEIKEKLDAQGITYKSGKWTDVEKAILRQNVKKYAMKHNLKDVSVLVLPGKGKGQ